MNKSLLGLAISALFMMGAAHAEVNPNDVSATLSVTGSVTHQVNCAVKISSSVVNLSADIETMAKQGAAGSQDIQTVEISLGGDEECQTKAGAGEIAYSFQGTADSADKTSIANTDLSANAATGVGIALYDVKNDKRVIKINQDTMAINSSNTVDHLGLALVKLNNQEVKAGSVNGSVTIQIEHI